MPSPLVPLLSQAARFAMKAIVFVVLLGAVFYWLGGRQPQVKEAAQDDPKLLAEAGIVPLTYEALAPKLASGDQPKLLFIYTSWCPFCHKVFPLVNALAQEKKVELIAVSVDKEPVRLAKFVKEYPGGVHFTPYNISNYDEQLKMEQDFQARGLRFTGAFPYFAMFRKGEPIGEVKGALEKDAFDGMVADIEAEAPPSPKP